ncbi:MAG: hypothetical protein ABJC24_10685 [Chloroflexota bacterium]
MRDPLVAALGALLIAGVSTAMANTHPAPASPPAVKAEEPAGAPDTDTIQEGDQTTPDSPAEAAGAEAESAAAEADGPGGHADDPNDPNADHQFEGEE